jgi:hypothetical protein
VGRGGPGKPNGDTKQISSLAGPSSLRASTSLYRLALGLLGRGGGTFRCGHSVEGANTSLLRDYSALLAEASSALPSSSVKNNDATRRRVDRRICRAHWQCRPVDFGRTSPVSVNGKPLPASSSPACRRNRRLGGSALCRMTFALERGTGARGARLRGGASLPPRQSQFRLRQWPT